MVVVEVNVCVVDSIMVDMDVSEALTVEVCEVVVVAVTIAVESLGAPTKIEQAAEMAAMGALPRPVGCAIACRRRKRPKVLVEENVAMIDVVVSDVSVAVTGSIMTTVEELVSVMVSAKVVVLVVVDCIVDVREVSDEIVNTTTEVWVSVDCV